MSDELSSRLGREELRPKISLQRELEDSTLYAERLKRKLESIEESPGWRFIMAYREWLGRGGTKARLINGVARLAIRLFSIRGRKNPPAGLEGQIRPEDCDEQASHGVLIHCLDPVYMGRVFYCRDGRRHWVRSREHVVVYGPGLDYVVLVNSEDMRQYELAAPLPLPWSESAWTNPIRTDP